MDAAAGSPDTRPAGGDPEDHHACPTWVHPANALIRRDLEPRFSPQRPGRARACQVSPDPPLPATEEVSHSAACRRIRAYRMRVSRTFHYAGAAPEQG